MKKIFFSNENTIAYDDKGVYVDGKILSEEDKKENESNEDCANRLMRNTYQNILAKQYENIVVLTGAGSSYNIGKTNQGKLMTGLWNEVKKALSYQKIKEFADQINFLDVSEENTNLEDFISHADLYQKISTPDNKITSTINEIKSIIRNNCHITISENAPHHEFIKKLTSRKTKYSRTKIFTLNYDTLFEQAASDRGYIIIDGFSFSSPRQFNGAYFDYDIVSRASHKLLSEENFVSNVIHLYKPHGSIDWEESNGKIFKISNTKKPIMIYPSSTKYESSYRQPFFEMMSRFQQETRSKNTLLIIIGFSFGDAHITAMIKEALNVNLSITMLIVSPDVTEEKEQYKFFKEKAEKSGNINLINETFESFVKYYPLSDVYDRSEERRFGID
ncbi:SIR2 family protein [Virgibacillus pantothenticus]|uniref:SIR2 family protein n=1 Tax=Virgibacillus pantothenticus TaxID=1473 RepID=UPI0025B1E61E|nr:SIR2 family protein [Virgibacillus pantothenticus]